MTFCFFLAARSLFVLFVKEAAVVLNAADGRNRVGRDLDQVQATLAGDLQGLKGRQNAHLFAVFVDDADFARANPVVDADKGLCRTFVECDGAPPKVIPGPTPDESGIATGARTHPEYSIGLAPMNKGFTADFTRTRRHRQEACPIQRTPCLSLKSAKAGLAGRIQLKCSPPSTCDRRHQSQ